MQTFWEEKLKVRAYDVDFKNKLKVSSVFNYMQDVASNHADNEKVGYKHLFQNDLFWVLSWVKLEFSSLPKFEDNFRIKTWPKGKYKLYALRDFLLYDKNNEVFCKVASAWLLLNIKSKRIADLKNLPEEIPFNPNEYALNVLPEKIPGEDTNEIVLSKQINYSDIDINRHVNNAKYIEFILDSYSWEFHKRNFMRSIEVSFKSETMYDDIIEIGLNKNSGKDRSHYIEGINKVSGKQAFQALINWKQEALNHS